MDIISKNQRNIGFQYLPATNAQKEKLEDLKIDKVQKWFLVASFVVTDKD